MTAAGGCAAAAASAAFGGLGGVDVEAGAAQRRAERAQDLRLVVDDEDALLHAGSSAGTSTTGSASANVAPCPGRDSAQTRPPFAAAKPRAIASPSPARSAVAAAAIERLEDAFELALRRAPGPGRRPARSPPGASR